MKAESATINMPEGMTKGQADEMLKELKAIHQFLERQQAQGLTRRKRQNRHRSNIHPTHVVIMRPEK